MPPVLPYSAQLGGLLEHIMEHGSARTAWNGAASTYRTRGAPTVRRSVELFQTGVFTARNRPSFTRVGRGTLVACVALGALPSLRVTYFSVLRGQRDPNHAPLAAIRGLSAHPALRAGWVPSSTCGRPQRDAQALPQRHADAAWRCGPGQPRFAATESVYVDAGAGQNMRGDEGTVASRTPWR
jgi:hypothetical protein